MNGKRSILAFYALVLIAIILPVALAWFNYHLLPTLNTNDYFITYWVSTRLWLKDGANPYSESVMSEVQKQAVTLAPKASVPLPEFNHPIYADIIILPFAFINDYLLAKALWMTALELGIFLIVWKSMGLIGWRPHIVVMSCIFLLVFIWYPTVASIFSGNLIVWTVIFIVLALSAIRSGLDELAGISLAFATIIPQAVILFIVYVLFWSATQKRWKIIVWTFGSVILLSTAAFLFMPNWIFRYLHTLLYPAQVSYLITPGAALTTAYPGLGMQLGRALNILSAAVLVFEWFLSRAKGFRWFLWTASLTLVLGLWIGIPTHSVYIVILLIPLVIVLGTLEEHWGLFIRWMTLPISLLLLVVSWLPFFGNIPGSLHPENYPFLLFPIPFLLWICLYWIRWWVIRPSRFVLSTLKTKEEY